MAALSRLKTWISEILTAGDLNAEFDNILTYINTTGITTTALLASSDDVGALGASGTAWSDLFLASGGVINWNAGDVTATHAANTLTFAGATTGYVFSNGPMTADLTNATNVPIDQATGTLPVANGGTNATSASITAFNNITGYTAAGATGTTSTNLVFSTSPTFITPVLGTPSSGTLSSCDAASTTVAGVTEHATAAEVDTSTATNRSVTPGAFSDSVYGIRYVPIAAFGADTDCATGNGKAFFHVPPGLNGMDLMYIHGEAATAGTTGSMTVMVRKNAATDMLSTALTWDTTESGTDTAATPAVIKSDASEAVATNDVISIDVDGVQTTAAKGMVITLGFRIP